jgi:hypothetical protein
MGGIDEEIDSVAPLPDQRLLSRFPDLVEHLNGQPAGLGVLAGRMVGGEQPGQAGARGEEGGMGELDTRDGGIVTAVPIKQPFEGDPSQGNEALQMRSEQVDFCLEKRAAGSDFAGERLVIRRGAAAGCADE